MASLTLKVWRVRGRSLKVNGALLSIFATRYEGDKSLASSLVALETLLSALTMPAMIGLAVALC